MEAVIQNNGNAVRGFAKRVFGKGPMGRGEFVSRVLLGLAAMMGVIFMAAVPEIIGIQDAATMQLVGKAMTYLVIGTMVVILAANYFWVYWRARDVAKTRSGAAQLFFVAIIVPFAGLLLYVMPGRQ